MTKSDVDILMEARDTIMDPDNWCQDALAKNVRGDEITAPSAAASRRAVRWCALGAVYKTLGVKGAKQAENPHTHTHTQSSMPIWMRSLIAAAQTMRASGPASVNDNQNHDAVMEMYDRALRFAKEAQESVD